MWITPAQIKARIADRLSMVVTALPPKWDGICADAVSAGYSDIVTRLRVKGYTQAQIDVWDDRIRYLTDQAVFWACVNGGIAAGYDDKEFNKLDHRKELEGTTLAIMIGGAIVLPGEAGGIGGSVLGGRLALDNGNVSGPSTFRTQRDRRAQHNLPDTGPLYDPRYGDRGYGGYDE
jgi:hypothetical protein